MRYNKEILNQIRTFGALAYDYDMIVKIIRPSDPMQFQREFNNPESDVFTAYSDGLHARQYTVDVAEFEERKKNAELAKIEVQNKKKYLKTREELFNI